MGNIFEIGGNRDMLCVSQERVVKVLRVIIQNGHRQRYFFWCLNIQHYCLKRCLIILIYLTQFKDYNHAIKIGIEGL